MDLSFTTPTVDPYATGAFSLGTTQQAAPMPMAPIGTAVAAQTTTTPVSSSVGAPVAAAPVAGGAATAGAGGGGGFFQPGGGAQMALGAIQTLGSLWNSYQQTKLAKESLSFQKEAFTTNLANQEQTYNTALEDRINSRYNTEGRSNKEARQYVNKHKL